MPSIQQILQNRLNASKDNKLESHFENEKSEYRKKWLNGVQYFMLEINKERVKDKRRLVSFMSIYKKVEHIKELDDLRWFYKQCWVYKNKKKENSFGKCFYGSLKIR